MLAEPNNEESSKQDGDMRMSVPPVTLFHLARFWDRMSESVTKIAIRNQVNLLCCFCKFFANKIFLD